jgi:hypothetical protein
MADFNAIVEDVFTITNARHLVNETTMAVKSAVLQLHRRDNFAKDLAEFTIEFPTSDNLQSIDYRTLFPQYRSLAYLRKYDNSGAANAGAGKFFEIITPAQVLDSYQRQRSDVCYLAGALINIRSCEKFQYAMIGFYQNPNVASPATFNSWIADEAYYAVVYLAASIIFGSSLGDSARQVANSRLADIEAMELINSNIVAKGE